MCRWFAEGRRVNQQDFVVNKITWQKAGRVTKPGRYMFTFGWLTVTADDLAVWEVYPEASFTLVEVISAPILRARRMARTPGSISILAGLIGGRPIRTSRSRAARSRPR